MKQIRPNRNFTLLAILTLWFLPASAGDCFAAQKTARGKKPLVKKQLVKVVELGNLEQLKAAFQRDGGKVRLLTILSPT